jgi:hypothetical protein
LVNPFCAAGRVVPKWSSLRHAIHLRLTGTCMREYWPVLTLDPWARRSWHAQFGQHTTILFTAMSYSELQDTNSRVALNTLLPGSHLVLSPSAKLIRGAAYVLPCHG